MTALPAPSDEHVRALAVTILKRSEFAFWHDTPWLMSFLVWLSGLWETDPVLYWAMLAGLVAVALLLLAHVTWAVRRALAVAPPARPPRPDGAAPPFLEEADALARRGLFLEAARRVQLAALGLLLRARVLELGRSDPNRTLRRRLRDAALPVAGGALGPGGRDGGALPRPGGGRGRQLRAPRGRGPAPSRRGRACRRRSARRVEPAPGDGARGDGRRAAARADHRRPGPSHLRGRERLEGPCARRR